MVDGRLANNIGLVIQARMNSKRLPGKVLMPMPLGSKLPLLSKIINSLRNIGGEIIVATSTDYSNDPIVAFCLENDITCYRGDENDVFSRFFEIQKEHLFKYVFRFTADNPFIDSEKLLLFFSEFKKKGFDYAKSVGLPIGMNFEVINGGIIEKLAKFDLSDDEKEHVTARINKENEFNKGCINLGNSAKLRMTVDTPIDYLKASSYFQLLGDSTVTIKNIINITKNNSWLNQINEGILQNCSTEDIYDQVQIIQELCIAKNYFKVAEILKINLK